MHWDDIAARLEAAGFNNFCINYERGIAVVFFDSLPAEKILCQTENRCQQKSKEVVSGVISKTETFANTF